MQDDEHSTKTDAAYRLLRRDILTTRLMPGAPLKLSALRTAYGVGWTPLREALSRLEAERLVTAISNRGFAVAPVSRGELEDLARARMVVELPLLLESIEKGDSGWEEAVVTAHYRLSRCKTAVDDPSDLVDPRALAEIDRLAGREGYLTRIRMDGVMTFGQNELARRTLYYERNEPIC